MTIVCPSGHASSTTDYCDQCGAPIEEPAPPDPVLPDLESVDDEDTSPAARREPCPRCGAARSGDDRYCEACGHDYLSSPSVTAAWELVATADRAQFERVAGDDLSFPADFGERRFPLDGPEVRIGRSRGSGGPTPEIDLAGSPEDPGISRLHVVLDRQDDGTYVLRDLGSTNGTTVNDDLDAVGPGAAVPLVAGDRIRIGAWTTITLRAC